MNLLTVVYLGITAIVTALAGWCLFTEENPLKQATAVMVILPLLLRLLLIK